MTLLGYGEEPIGGVFDPIGGVRDPLGMAGVMEGVFKPFVPTRVGTADGLFGVLSWLSGPVVSTGMGTSDGPLALCEGLNRPDSVGMGVLDPDGARGVHPAVAGTCPHSCSKKVVVGTTVEPAGEETLSRCWPSTSLLGQMSAVLSAETECGSKDPKFGGSQEPPDMGDEAGTWAACQSSGVRGLAI